VEQHRASPVVSGERDPDRQRIGKIGEDDRHPEIEGVRTAGQAVAALGGEARPRRHELARRLRHRLLAGRDVDDLLVEERSFLAQRDAQRRGHRRRRAAECGVELAVLLRHELRRFRRREMALRVLGVGMGHAGLRQRGDDVGPARIRCGRRAEVGADDEVLERLAFGVAVAPQHRGRGDRLEAEVRPLLGREPGLVRLEILLVERPAVAREVHGAGAQPIAVPDAQPRQRPRRGREPGDERRIAGRRIVALHRRLVALARFHDALARPRHRRAPAFPAEHRLVQVEIVGGRRMVGPLGRGRRALHVALVADLELDRRFAAHERRRRVIGDPLVERVPPRAARSVGVANVDAVAAHEVLGVEHRRLPGLELGVLAARRSSSSSFAARKREPG
jgi:hypothetical protein